MALIYETENFIVEAVEKPHVDRDDGGHIKITPKTRILNRQQLTSQQAIELMKLTMVVGEAMSIAMNKQGVDIGRINYQDNGNWTVFKAEGSYFHYHIYGRAKSAKIQKYGDALYMPHRERHPEFYSSLRPLNQNDVSIIKDEIIKLFNLKKYSDALWGL